MLEDPADLRLRDGATERSALRRLLRTGLTIAAAVGLVTIVALASRTTSVVSSAMEIDTGFIMTAIEVVGYVAAIVGLLVFLPTILVLRARRRQRLAASRAAGRGVAPWWARIGGLAATLAILAAQVAIVVYVVDLLRSRSSGATDGLLDPLTGLDPNGLGAGRDSSSLMIALVIVTALAVVAVALAIRWRLRDAADQAEAVDDRRGMTGQAVEVGLDALRREPDPRRAIIAAYAAMERSLSHAGLGRHPWEAPIEYLRRILAGALGAPEDVQTMTHLFEVAKFSQHSVDESMRSGAIGALERIRTATHLAASAHR